MNPALAYLVKHGATHKLATPCQVIGDDPLLTVPIVSAILKRQTSSNIFTQCRVAICEKIPAASWLFSMICPWCNGQQFKK